MDENGIDGTMDSIPNSGWNILYVIVAAVLSALATLWKLNEGKNAKRITELELLATQCQVQHDATRKRLDEALEHLADTRVQLAEVKVRLDMCEGIGIPGEQKGE